MRLSKVYISRASEFGTLVVDVWEQTDLQDALSESLALTRSSLGDRSLLLAVDILEDREVDIHLVNLVAVKTDAVVGDDLLCHSLHEEDFLWRSQHQTAALGQTVHARYGPSGVR